MFRVVDNDPRYNRGRGVSLHFFVCIGDSRDALVLCDAIFLILAVLVLLVLQLQFFWVVRILASTTSTHGLYVMLNDKFWYEFPSERKELKEIT